MICKNKLINVLHKIIVTNKYRVRDKGFIIFQYKYNHRTQELDVI